jgi:cysteine desulfurase
MIYLDNSATTRIDDRVFTAIEPWLREDYGNASSVYALGRRARVAVENAREEIAHLCGAHPAEIIFTSGGTESNNFALKSACVSSALARRLAVGATEHHAVLYPAEELRRRGAARVEILPVDAAGVVSLDALASWNEPETMISLMHANNETGVIQPIESARKIASRAYLHTDAVQTFGKIPLNLQELQVDFATLSAHKIHGPKGVGALFIRKGIDFKAWQQGGAQERNRRAGTEAVALIVGFQIAARLAVQEMAERADAMRARTALLRQRLLENIPHIRLNTPPPENALPNILNVSFTDAEGLDGEAILQAMDMRGIAVSNGSACVSGSLQPSHVLLAMGLPAAEAKAAVRFSVSKDTSSEEVVQAASALAEILAEMRGAQT